MRKCLFERDNLLERLDDVARKAGIEDTEAEIRGIKCQLAETLTAQQLTLFRAFDDAVVREGTARVNAALMVACGCRVCATSRSSPEGDAATGGTLKAA